MGVYASSGVCATLYKLIERYMEPGQVSVIAVSGQAGAGKTSLTRDFVSSWESYANGVPVAELGLDRYFRMSSADRKRWIEQGQEIGEEEYLKRSNNLAWFDFERIHDDLSSLKRGNPIQMRNVYDKKSGELSASLDIYPGDAGLVVISDGVFLLHFPEGIFDRIVYVHADAGSRKARVTERDGHRKGPEALAQRRQETQRSELPYMEQHIGAVHVLVDTTSEPFIVREGIGDGKKLLERSRELILNEGPVQLVKAV